MITVAEQLQRHKHVSGLFKNLQECCESFDEWFLKQDVVYHAASELLFVLSNGLVHVDFVQPLKTLLLSKKPNEYIAKVDYEIRSNIQTSYKADVKELVGMIWSFKLGFEKLQQIAAKAADNFWFYNCDHDWAVDCRILQKKELNWNLDELRNSSPDTMSSLFSVLNIHNQDCCIRDLKTAMDFFKSMSFRVVITCAVLNEGPKVSFYIFRKGLEQVIWYSSELSEQVYSSKSKPPLCWKRDDSKESFVDFLNKCVEYESDESESKRLKITSE